MSYDNGCFPGFKEVLHSLAAGLPLCSVSVAHCRVDHDHPHLCGQHLGVLLHALSPFFLEASILIGVIRTHLGGKLLAPGNKVG